MAAGLPPADADIEEVNPHPQCYFIRPLRVDEDIDPYCPKGNITLRSIISLRSNITRRQANITEAHSLTECASSLSFLRFISPDRTLVTRPISR